jgi:hypothetical protein
VDVGGKTKSLSPFNDFYYSNGRAIFLSGSFDAFILLP